MERNKKQGGSDSGESEVPWCGGIWVGFLEEVTSELASKDGMTTSWQVGRRQGGLCRQRGHRMHRLSGPGPPTDHRGGARAVSLAVA